MSKPIRTTHKGQPVKYTFIPIEWYKGKPAHNAIDLKGHKYSRLTVIRKVGYQVSPQSKGLKPKSMWECLCDCGETLIVDGRNLVFGSVKSCGCIKRNPHKLVSDIYCQYRHGAKKRGYAFELTVEDFEILIKSPCFYCGEKPSREYKNKYISGLFSGVDRVDNTKGYLKDNCVPCCNVCNFRKMGDTYDSFIEWVSRIYNKVVQNVHEA